MFGHIFTYESWCLRPGKLQYDWDLKRRVFFAEIYVKNDFPFHKYVKEGGRYQTTEVFVIDSV